MLLRTLTDLFGLGWAAAPAWGGRVVGLPWFS